MFWTRKKEQTPTGPTVADQIRAVVEYNLTQLQAITSNLVSVVDRLATREQIVLAEIRRAHDSSMNEVIRIARLMVAQSEAQKDIRTSQLVAGLAAQNLDFPASDPRTNEPPDEPPDEPPTDPEELPPIPDEELVGMGPPA